MILTQDFGILESILPITSILGFTFLYLGISAAVFIFTAILKPVVVLLHTLGFRSGIYIDDILSMGDDIFEALRCNTAACDTHAKAGFVIKEKQKTVPSQRLLYLGFEVLFC